MTVTLVEFAGFGRAIGVPGLTAHAGDRAREWEIAFTRPDTVSPATAEE